MGEKYSISRERVRQIEERVKKKLRAYLAKEFKDMKDAMADAG
ncbi:MAG: sigma factor-like helix-turn-helix DNA-binding protein [Candidatus Binatia bacterium]